MQQAKAEDALHKSEQKRLNDFLVRHCETGQRLALDLKVAEQRQEKAAVQAEEAETEMQQTKKAADAQKKENKLTKRKLKIAGKKDRIL